LPFFIVTAVKTSNLSYSEGSEFGALAVSTEVFVTASPLEEY
jgi:hypothetical protein